MYKTVFRGQIWWSSAQSWRSVIGQEVWSRVPHWRKESRSFAQILSGPMSSDELFLCSGHREGTAHRRVFWSASEKSQKILPNVYDLLQERTEGEGEWDIHAPVAFSNAKTPTPNPIKTPLSFGRSQRLVFVRLRSQLLETYMWPCHTGSLARSLLL